jgi:NAD+ synthase (glutamine-hydrolysing)
MRVAAAFVNTTPLDWEGNARAAGKALGLARGLGAQIALLPELCLTGYGCEDAFWSQDLRLRALNSLEAFLPRTEGIIAALGLPFEFEGLLYNVMAVCADGELVALVPKQNLASDGIHYEPRWFSPWQRERRESIRLFGNDVALGDWIVKAGEAMLGFEICHDAWVECRPYSGLKARGANLILCPSASHFALGKQLKREALVLEAAGHGLAYAYSNLMGNEAGRVIYDGGAMLAGASGVVARGARFSYQDAGVVCADLALKPAGKGEGVAVSAWAPGPSQLPLPPQAAEALDEDGEFERAVALGLFDYLRKSKAKGFMLSLSGGADSAACAVLVDAMRGRATAELGAEGFASRLGHAEPLLSCVYQATGQSGPVTRQAARGLAQGLGAPFIEFEIEPLVAQYRSMVEGALGRPLDWKRDDLTLQNLQARVRSPGVWALANATHCLLLATNNRSEAAAGYTSMDGDTSGGLAPIAGIGKHFLRAWLRRQEARLPALTAVNVQEPTAELRPAAAKQTDEADLMPYEVLDAIERLAARDHLAPREAYEEAARLLPQFDAKKLGAWVLRYFELWSRSQWKRERLAPSFHLDDHNLDPRSGRRFPILSGGYEAELAELRAFLGL